MIDIRLSIKLFLKSMDKLEGKKDSGEKRHITSPKLPPSVLIPENAPFPIVIGSLI